MGYVTWVLQRSHHKWHCFHHKWHWFSRSSPSGRYFIGLLRALNQFVHAAVAECFIGFRKDTEFTLSCTIVTQRVTTETWKCKKTKYLPMDGGSKMQTAYQWFWCQNGHLKIWESIMAGEYSMQWLEYFIWNLWNMM